MEKGGTIYRHDERINNTRNIHEPCKQTKRWSQRKRWDRGHGWGPMLCSAGLQMTTRPLRGRESWACGQVSELSTVRGASVDAATPAGGHNSHESCWDVLKLISWCSSPIKQISINTIPRTQRSNSPAKEQNKLNAPVFFSWSANIFR